MQCKVPLKALLGCTHKSGLCAYSTTEGARLVGCCLLFQASVTSAGAAIMAACSPDAEELGLNGTAATGCSMTVIQVLLGHKAVILYAAHLALLKEPSHWASCWAVDELGASASYHLQEPRYCEITDAHACMHYPKHPSPCMAPHRRPERSRAVLALLELMQHAMTCTATAC